MNVEPEVIAHSEERPLPTPNQFSQPFWDAARQHRLLLQKCDLCGTIRYYPRPRCPECLSADATWTEMSGRGSVYTFTVVHRALARWFQDHLPLVCAVVELEEGVRIVSNVEQSDGSTDVHIGMPV
jgi:uncharacterized OB-fold protein